MELHSRFVRKGGQDRHRQTQPHLSIPTLALQFKFDHIASPWLVLDCKFRGAFLPSDASDVSDIVTA